MNWLTPGLAALVGTVAIPSLLILYFLKLRRRDVEVSSTLLWNKAIQDLQANAPFQRLRRNILLFLQLLALAGALFALAQPEIRALLSGGSRHVIVIDRSGSMNAMDGKADDFGSRSRLDEAKRLAKEFVDSMREPGLLDQAGDQAMVVAFDQIADRVANFTSNKAELKRVIDEIEATDVQTKFAPAFETARAFARPVAVEDKGLIVPGGAATVHLFSDGRLPDLESLTTNAEDRILYYPVGSKDSWNVAIVGLRAERSFEDPNQVSIFVGLQNTSSQPRRVDLQLAVDGKVREIPPLTLPAQRLEEGVAVPGGSGRVFTLDLPQGGVITLQARTLTSDAEPGDALASDNFGYLVVPPVKRLSVLLVTDGNLFIRDAISAGNPLKFDTLAPVQAAELFKDGKPAGYDVVVLDGWLPQIKALDGKTGLGLPPGRYVVFNANPQAPLGLDIAGKSDEPTTVIKFSRDHQALRNIALDGLIVSGGFKSSIPVRSNARTLAEGVNGPLIYETADVATRAIVTTFDVLQTNNWPLDAGFVLFMLQAVDYLGQEGGLASANLIRPGETIEQLLPGESTEARITLPDSTRKDLLLSPEGRVVYGPVPRVGIYTLSWTGQGGPMDAVSENRVRRAVAANMLNARESDLATAEPEALNRILLNVQTGEQKGVTRRLWPWLVLTALVILLIEWYVYHRKVSI